MKNLIKKISGVGFILLFALTISAQEDYKIKMTSGGKVIIHSVDKVDIEGHNGTEVIITGKFKKRKKDDRAAGLRVISGSGSVDNTGLGLSAIKNGNELTIEQVGKNSKGRYTIKIPQGVSLLYEHDTHDGDDLNIRNFKGEIEVSAHYNEVRMENVTGPMSVNTVHGDVDADFTTVSQTNPITIRSSHGLIDVSMPKSTAANVKMKAVHGDMFTDFNLVKNTTSKKSGDDCRRCDNDSMDAKINGGGVEINLRSSHGNIYFRTKK